MASERGGDGDQGHGSRVGGGQTVKQGRTHPGASAWDKTLGLESERGAGNAEGFRREGPAANGTWV